MTDGSFYPSREISIRHVRHRFESPLVKKPSTKNKNFLKNLVFGGGIFFRVVEAVSVTDVTDRSVGVTDIIGYPSRKNRGSLGSKQGFGGP